MNPRNLFGGMKRRNIILAGRQKGEAMTKRPVESTEDFKLRIAALVGDKREQISGAPRPNPMLAFLPRTVAVREEARQAAETALTLQPNLAIKP